MTLNPTSDGSLLRNYRAGSQEAATELYKRYSMRLRRLAKNNFTANLARRLDVDDVVQSVFRRFFAAVDKGNYELPSGEDLWALLMVITLNRVRLAENYHRAVKRDVRVTQEDGGLLVNNQPDLRADDVGRSEMREMVREALEQLPDQHREMVELRLQGHEVSDIAQHLTRSKRTVERVLQQARDHLRTILERDYAS